MGNSFASYTSSTPPKNYYTFNGMEFQQDNNLNTFDFHARMYDPQIGRTFQPDPLADQFLALSPYSFLNNNPINYMDPTGMKFIDKFYEGNGGGGGWNSTGGGFNGVTYGGANLAPNPLGSTYAISMGLLETMSNPKPESHVSYYVGDDGILTMVDYLDWGPVEKQYKSVQDNGGVSQAEVGELDEHWLGPALLALASPIPKRFVAANSSQTSAVLSEVLSKTITKKIQVGTTRRLYTHTVNGSARYAATWGRFLGRWATRIAGPLGLALTTYDFINMVAIPMGDGVTDYTKTYKDAGLIYHIK